MTASEDETFGGLVTARWGALVRTAYLLTGDQQQAEDMMMLRAALMQLGRRQRTVLVLRHFEDLSEQQVADALGHQRRHGEEHGAPGTGQSPGCLRRARPSARR